MYKCSSFTMIQKMFVEFPSSRVSNPEKYPTFFSILHYNINTVYLRGLKVTSHVFNCF